MKQGAFPAFVDHRLTGFIGPSHHLNRGRGVVGHQVDNLADRYLAKQFVQFYEDCRTLRPDFEHLVIGKGSEATDTQLRNLLRQTFGPGWNRKERSTIGREIRWPNPCDPSVAVDGLGHGSGVCQDPWVDFLQNATDGRPNRADPSPRGPLPMVAVTDARRGWHLALPVIPTIVAPAGHELVSRRIP